MKTIQRIFLTAAFGSLVASGCVATHKYVRNEVKTSADELDKNLSTKIDRTNEELKETRDGVTEVNKKVVAVDQRVTGVDNRVSGVDQKVSGVDQKVSGVDNKVSDLDSRTTQGINTLKTDVSSVNTKTEGATRDINSLSERFKNRNNLQVSLEKSVQFKFDSAALQTTQTAALDEIAALLSQNPDAMVVLEGHTDNAGDAEYNMKLGERRVDAIRRYLAIEKSVPVYRIEQISFGAAKPVAPNNSKDGREKNRSVSVTVLSPSLAARSSN